MAVRVYRSSVLLRSLMYEQRPDFIQSEVPNIEATIIAHSVRELLFYVAYAIEVNVVQHDKLIILRCYNVLFEIISPHGVGESFGRKRVLGKIA